MVGTNVNISKKAQELLIKAAAERKVSVETLASEILNESIQNKFSQINTNVEWKRNIPLILWQICNPTPIMPIPNNPLFL